MMNTMNDLMGWVEFSLKRASLIIKIFFIDFNPNYDINNIMTFFFNNNLILSLKPQSNQIEYGDPGDEFKGDVDPRRKYVLKDLINSFQENLWL